MKVSKRIRVVKLVVLTVALIVSAWAALRAWVHLTMGKMVFIDSFLDGSHQDFLHNIPETVRDDVLAGHDRVVHLLAWPLILAVLAWFGVYLLTEWQRKHGEQDCLVAEI